MKMKGILLAATLWLPAFSQAGPLSEPVTVATFVKDFSPTPEPNKPRRTPTQFLRYQKAQGFIDGVKAATVGKVWCYDRRIAPVEIDSEVYHDLKVVSASEQMEEAAPVIIRKLALKYPCKEHHP